MPLANDTITREGLFSNSDGTFTRGTLPNSAAGFFSTDSLLEATNRSSNVFDDWFNPQDKELRQQGYQMMQDYLSPQNKMAGMRAAGINPLTAAAGIAGSQSSSPQPASSVNPIGDIAGAVGSAAAGFNSVAGGVSVLGKLGCEIENIQSDSALNFANIGLTNAQTQGVMTDNKYKDDDWKASLNVKRQQFENMKEEWNNLKSTHEEILKHIDAMQSQIELNGSQADYLDSFKAKLDEETRWLQAKNDFCIGHSLYLLESGLDGYIFSMIESGADMSQFDRFVEVYSNYRESVAYHTQKGVKTADVENAYREAFEEAKARTDVEALFREWFNDEDAWKEIFVQSWKSALENPKDIKGAAAKFINQILTVFDQLKVGANHNAKGPFKPSSSKPSLGSGYGF